ncbi:hypothetical protein [Gordonia desulfuricans]|uniref:hypothetical protein n=1 Tax=Gordonia desulfuricans TaxID=89051 RepID=UPI00157A9092|nr:hypothetical protein [Gordonia desulfuricans]
MDPGTSQHPGSPPHPGTGRHPRAVSGSRLPVIADGVPILVRPDNRVHIGGDPQTGLVLELPESASGPKVAALLGSLREPRTRTEVFAELVDAGLTRAELDTILAQLLAAGKASHSAFTRPSTERLRIRVHGTGPLTRLLATTLADAGFVVTHTVRRPAHRDAPSPRTNLVVLTDHLAHESWLVDRLMADRVPHLQVRLRDGVGLLGPLVLPGLSSCLACADRHRTDRDPEWPVLRGQLTGVAGNAGDPITRMTAALAHDQIDRLASALAVGASEPPYLLGRVIEVHGSPPRLSSTVWPRHPLCPFACGTPSASGTPPARVAGGHLS